MTLHQRFLRKYELMTLVMGALGSLFTSPRRHSDTSPDTRLAADERELYGNNNNPALRGTPQRVEYNRRLGGAGQR